MLRAHSTTNILQVTAFAPRHGNTRFSALSRSYQLPAPTSGSSDSDGFDFRHLMAAERGGKLARSFSRTHRAPPIRFRYFMLLSNSPQPTDWRSLHYFSALLGGCLMIRNFPRSKAAMMLFHITPPPDITHMLSKADFCRYFYISSKHTDGLLKPPARRLRHDC